MVDLADTVDMVDLADTVDMADLADTVDMADLADMADGERSTSRRTCARPSQTLARFPISPWVPDHRLEL
jgi:hypothetical protein